MSTEAKSSLRLLLVDDHDIVREGLKRVLENYSADWQVAEARSGFQALDCLRLQTIDLVIVDLSLPGMNGLDLILRIKANYPSIGVLVLSMHAEEQYAMRSFRAGANGYITKDSAAKELVTAVNKVASGGAYVTPSLAEQVVMQLKSGTTVPSHNHLSNRELDVLRRLIAGQRLTDIAADLNLSIKTVSTHKTHIQKKLHLPNLAALVRYGLHHQLDQGPLEPGGEKL
jgi:DNA-binding NarL/FixJ family response regulator